MPSIILGLVLGKAVVGSLPEFKMEETAKIPSKNAVKQETVSYASDTIAVELRRNDLSAADKDEISHMNSRQIMAKYGGSGRRAREWRNLAKRGQL